MNGVFYMKKKNIFVILFFSIIIGNTYANDILDTITSLAKRYEIQPSLVISIITEASSDLFSESRAARFFAQSRDNGFPALGSLWGDFSPVTRDEAYSNEYIRYWLLRYIGYLHHPDFKFTQWQIAAAFYDSDGNILRGNISPTGRAFANRVINNISLYSSYDQ
jgi:hypothetical protein